MTHDPMHGGQKPDLKISYGIDLLKLPFIGPILCRLLGGGIGPKDSQKSKGG